MSSSKTHDSSLLSGLHVLVTRPAHQAARLSALLSALGVLVSRVPAMAIEPLMGEAELQHIRQCLQRLQQFDRIIFVSVNAAEQALAHAAQLALEWPEAERLFTVGQSSADFLADAGLCARFPQTRMDSEGLLALPAMQEVAGKQVLVFRGRGGRELIADTLRARGAVVESCELYQRVAPPESAAALAMLGLDFDVLLANSAESLQNILSLVEVDRQKGYKQKYVVVPGERVAEKARALGFQRIITAANATDVAVVEALIDKARCDGTGALVST